MTTQPDSTATDKAIARIQKLLTLSKAGRGATEGEAESAMRMAQEIALKNNLDIAQIEAAGASQEGSPVERVKEEFKGRAMYKWQTQLAKYVAESNFCYHIVQTKERYIEGHEGKDGWVHGRYQTTKTNLFIGRKGNVITAQLMYQYLTQTIEDLVPIQSNAQRLSRSAMSWKEGCADRLCERLAKRRQDLINEHDARMKQEAEDRAAERRQAAEEAAKRRKNVLTADHKTEVKAKYDAIANDATDRVRDVPEADEPDRPEADEEPWTPEGDEVAEPETGTALVLASQFDDSEREANYELAHGLAPGSLAKWRREREERAKQEAEQEAEEVIEQAEAPVKEETERQRKAREKREADAMAKQRRRWAREDDAAARRAWREHAKRDHSAYNAGASAGKSIGLDAQVKAGKDVKKLG